MITNKEYIPIASVSSVPVYSGKTKDGLIKSEYWSVVVDFAGGGVPEMFVWGGHVHESRPVDKPEKLYSGRYPIVTRVEYRFPHGVLRNTYKNVCRFRCKITSRTDKIQKHVGARVWDSIDETKSQIQAAAHDENVK